MTPSVGKSFVIGLAGGTGSGKSTVAARLAEAIGEDRLALLTLDAYYRDRSYLSSVERAAINYDHPDAFDWALLFDHVRALVGGHSVPVPTYDFSQDMRGSAVVVTAPAPVVLVEGILVLYEPALRELFDLKLYVDTDSDVRFIRRLRRDIAERGRTVDNVIAQYLGTVRPGHEQFVEPSKRHADVIIPEGGRNEPALDVLLARLRELVSPPHP